MPKDQASSALTSWTSWWPYGIIPRVFDMVMPTFRSNIEFYHGSIPDLDAVTMAMDQVNAVFHLTAVADVGEVVADPHYAESINVRGTINVLEAMRRTKVPAGHTVFTRNQNVAARWIFIAHVLAPSEQLGVHTRGEAVSYAFRHGLLADRHR